MKKILCSVFHRNWRYGPVTRMAVVKVVAAVGPERFLASLSTQEQQAAPEVAVLPHLVSTAISARWGIPCEVITEC